MSPLELPLDLSFNENKKILRTECLSCTIQGSYIELKHEVNYNNFIKTEIIVSNIIEFVVTND